MPDRIVPGADVAQHYCANHLSKVVANGYHAFPIKPGVKKAHWKGWTRWCQKPPRPDQVTRWAERHNHYGLAIAAGYACIAIDSDEEDPGRAAEVEALANATLGSSPLVRIGRAPRWVRVYRPCTAPMRSRQLAPAVELIAARRYFVAHGIHPGTGQPYTWPDRAPETCPLADVPVVGVNQIARFAALLAGLYGLPVPVLDYDEGAADTSEGPPDAGTPGGRARATRHYVQPYLPYPRDAQGRVCEGREAYLTRCVYAAFCAGATEAADIADAAWARFAATADLARGKRGGERPWTHADALGKARALLARNKPRPARRALIVQDAWAPAQRAAFRNAVDARGARGALAPSAVAVSHAMLEYARTSGVCCASPATLAAMVGSSLSAVKTARRALIAAGLWSATNTRGGRACGADYRPVIAILDRGDGELAAEWTSPPQERNGADPLHPNNRFVCELPPPYEARDGTPRSATDLTPSVALSSSSSSEAASPRCHAQREPAAVFRAAQMPPASAPSSRAAGDDA